MAFDKTPVLVLDNVTVAASNVQTSTGMDLGAAFDFCIGYSFAFHASATLGARIDLYADPDGNTQDFTIGTYDNPYDSAEIALSAGHTVAGVLPFLRSPKWVKARIVNLDTGQAITSCSLWSMIQTP